MIIPPPGRFKRCLCSRDGVLWAGDSESSMTPPWISAAVTCFEQKVPCSFAG